VPRAPSSIPLGLKTHAATPNISPGIPLKTSRNQKTAEEMVVKEKDFKQELGITEGKCASP
jgi:hypothetical protein